MSADIGPVFGKMAKSLQGGSADETIKKLGINLDELKKKPPAEQFRILGAAMNLPVAGSRERRRVLKPRSRHCLSRLAGLRALV